MARLRTDRMRRHLSPQVPDEFLRWAEPLTEADAQYLRRCREPVGFSGLVFIDPATSQPTTLPFDSYLRRG